MARRLCDLEYPAGLGSLTSAIDHHSGCNCSYISVYRVHRNKTRCFHRHICNRFYCDFFCHDCIFFQKKKKYTSYSIPTSLVFNYRCSFQRLEFSNGQSSYSTWLDFLFPQIETCTKYSYSLSTAGNFSHSVNGRRDNLRFSFFVRLFATFQAVFLFLCAIPIKNSPVTGRFLCA